MSESWFYRAFGEEFGPISLSDLRDMAQNGTLSGDDEVRPEALTVWVPAKAVRELQDLYQPQIERPSKVSKIESDSQVPVQALDEWYYRFEDSRETEVGPLPFESIVELAKSSRLLADDEVRLGVDGKWRRAGSMGRLVAVLPYQTKRSQPSRLKPEPVAAATPVVAKTDSVQDLFESLSDSSTDSSESVDSSSEQTDTLPDIAAEETQIERQTVRPKNRTLPANKKPETSDKQKPTAAKSKSQRADPAHAVRSPAKPDSRVSGKAAPKSLSEEIEADIEDQILDELMNSNSPTPTTSSTTNYTPSADPPTPRPIPQSPAIPVAAVPSRIASPEPSPSSMSDLIAAAAPKKPIKSPKSPRSGPSFADQLKNPRVISGLAMLAPLVLIVSWFMMPESKAGDIKAYKTLDELFTELRETRKTDKDGKKLSPIGKKLEEAAIEIGKQMKKSADAEHPARQSLLWAAQSVPAVVKSSLGGEGAKEKEVLAHLNNAAVALGLKEAPPPVAIADAYNEP